MSAPEPYTAAALWSAGEIREQAQQVPGQLDVWDILGDACAACNAEPGEPCRVGCVGEASYLDQRT